MVRVGLVGLGKMGISHHAILNAHPEIELAAVCDATQYVLDVLNKYTGVKIYNDYRAMLAQAQLDCVLIATPSRTHTEMVRLALEHNLDVFCEKPFVLDPRDGAELVEIARARDRVTQVGYHYRFVGAFREAQRLLAAGAIGELHHVRAEAYGPVVLKAKGSTWRAAKSEGGGCLYDYASHAIDMVNFLVGPPNAVSGTVLSKVFSRDVDDEVYSTLHFPSGLRGQLAANWSDESYRRMTTRLTLWGKNGRINVDRQECQLYLREPVKALPEFERGWTLRYTTELTEPVGFYLRGEEYSAQIDHFVQAVKARKTEHAHSFEAALATDKIVAMLVRDAEGSPAVATATPNHSPQPVRAGLFARLFAR